MDEFMGELGSRLKFSITDSTMMCIVHDAMDRAHEKVKSRGVIARLSEMSRFYELAIIQLEGCLKFVHEESEACGEFEEGHQDLLIDLADIRNHLLCRLQESEMAISDKDRELMERAETEWRLRQALEIKEWEMESLRARREGFHESKEGELQLSELKNSVDQQVWNIRQNLEVPEENHYHGFDLDWETATPRDDRTGNRRIERMGLHISNLKETLDLAFGKMQSSIFSSSEAGPAEHQWRWAVEKDVTISVIRGSVLDIQKNLEPRSADREEKKNRMPRLLNELQRLQRENEDLKFQEATSGQLYLDILRGFKDELCARLLDEFVSEVQIREGVLSSVLKRTVIETRSLIGKNLEFIDAGSRFREEIHPYIWEEKFRNIVQAKSAESNRNIQVGVIEEDDAFDRSVEVQNASNSMRVEPEKHLEELASRMEQSFLEFLDAISISQQSISSYIVKNNTRLENMKYQLELLSRQIDLLRKESVYKKAFIRRCQNLQKAETEVDLLGDQVDLLLGLLKMVHVKLCQHSADLEQYFEVSDMLMLIQKELA
ncbi:hypothetical protein SAY86_018563 [Trapa natans]|uniref:WPP domain-associated protein n=1 Tax=Trapa natans TaxID=22666 RepID=A0AAN7LN59_TRANT|nr:hypothetical protein SAY86_018563 [Trapa natans]